MIIVIAVSGAWGFWKGFINQAGSIAAVIVGLLACWLLGPMVMKFVAPGGTNPVGHMSYYAIAAGTYSVIYIVAYYSVILVAKMLRLTVHALFLRPLDRIAGAILSIAKSLIMVSFLLNIYILFSPDSDLSKSSKIANGRLVETVIDLGPRIVGVLTSETENHGTEQ
ncbi:MAG: CvpA family protein [Muribaculaceae bacterium]|nr:CvpA family protein [Muribaculaceae bacterium]